MIVTLRENLDRATVQGFMKRLEWMGARAVLLQNGGQARIGVVARGGANLTERTFRLLPEVASVEPLDTPYKMASRRLHPHDTVFDVGGTPLGGVGLVVMAGPCAVESEEQIHLAAAQVRAAGATVLRAGAYKPRTSPYAFQGLGEEGLRLMRSAADAQGMAMVTELVSPAHLDAVCRYADMVQVGARNMQNFELLKAVGGCGRPVLLKRGMSATYTDWLMAAEYVMAAGNEQVALCERGIRTFETLTRNTLDVAAIPVLRDLSHLPVVADPSHGTGLRAMVLPMALAAVSAGAHGLMIEVHPDPDRALSDGDQSLFPEQFGDLMRAVRGVAGALGRTVTDAEPVPAGR